MSVKQSILCILILFLSIPVYSQENDELALLIKDLKTKNKVKESSKLNKALDLTYKIKNDSIKNKYFLELSLLFSEVSDSLKFRETIKQSLQISKNIEDSSSLARCYWRLGDFFYDNQSDSSYVYYYKAKEIYSLINDRYQKGRMLFNMASIQSDVKDYTGSEIFITEAIEILKEYKDYDRLYNCYNLLGINYNNLDDYPKAIQYHNDALTYLRKSTNKNLLKEARTLNNIGVVYRNQGNHQVAVDNYNEALKYDSLFLKRPQLYATLLDNLAYSKFHLNDTSELPDLFYKALSIRDSLEINAGIITNKLHLSEYYLAKKDTVKSLMFSNDAMFLAKKTKSFRDLLVSYKLLARIDPTNDSKYLNDYIYLNDSLVKKERLIRNKFTRIRFETDEYISQNQRLSTQNTWIVATSSALIFFGFLIYIITQQRTRNKELEMERQQQRANEEIYNLMIDQQDKIEEGRKREKERISLELHDGILGRLFGTRLSLGSLNTKDDLSSKKMREQYIYELQSIEEEVRNISHELGADNFNSTTSYNTMIVNLLEEQSKITNFKYQIEDDDRIIWTDIPGHIKINIYRIIQESIQNINKYAQAENVILDFKKNGEHIILTVKDDGVGFDQAKRNSGIGLKNMKSRVALLHGQFTINSIPGKGTSISVDVPMT